MLLLCKWVNTTYRVLAPSFTEYFQNIPVWRSTDPKHFLVTVNYECVQLTYLFIQERLWINQTMLYKIDLGLYRSIFLFSISKNLNFLTSSRKRSAMFQHNISLYHNTINTIHILQTIRRKYRYVNDVKQNWQTVHTPLFLLMKTEMLTVLLWQICRYQ